jgi:Leucine-rich repeat (LRR) protein
VDLHGLKLTDVSWLAEELYYMNDDTEVESLDLSGNSLTMVPPGMLTYCPGLVNLFLRNNMLTALPKGLLRPCRNFKKLDLRFNQKLKQLSADFYVPRGAKVYIG